MKISKSLLLATATGAALSATSLSAVTVFLTDPDSVATAKWDSWEISSQDAGWEESQGSAQTSANDGTNSFVSTNVTTKNLASLAPVGGAVYDNDQTYAHMGGIEYSVSATLVSQVDYVRISFSGSDLSVAPSPAGATLIDSGSYVAGYSSPTEEGNSIDVFYYDFAFASPVTDFSATFGDAGGYSFSTVDAIQIETFSGTAPSAVPEPETYAAIAGILALGCAMLRRRVSTKAN